MTQILIRRHSPRMRHRLRFLDGESLWAPLVRHLSAVRLFVGNTVLDGRKAETGCPAPRMPSGAHGS